MRSARTLRSDRHRRHRRRHRPLLHLAEALESRRLLSASLSGGVLTVTTGAAADLINLSIASNNYSVTINGGAAQTIAVASVDSIVVNCNDGADGVFLGSVVDPVQINGGNGIDVVEVGWGDNQMNGITASVTFDGGADDDRVDLWDTGTTNRTFNIAGNTVTRSGWAGQLSYQSCVTLQITAAPRTIRSTCSSSPPG